MQTITPEEFFTDPKWQNNVLLDVRSPGEYATGKLSAAQSLPLFSDEERARVGTLYKQESPDAALLEGLDIAGGKMRQLVELARQLAPDNRVVVHCWRGGQRSGSVAWLLERAGMEVVKLAGGYKAARHYIRQYLAEDRHQLSVLSGPTGSGKTPVLLAMRQRGAKVIDLEGLANHKGSAFGAIGELPQPTTEEFENQLFAALRAIPEGSQVWVEDESRLIGHVYQPDEFYDRLIAAPVVVLEQPLDWRVDRLVELYGSYPKEDLGQSFERIRKRLGGQHLKAALEALEVNDYATAARIALVYYDKAYEHYGERRKGTIVARVMADSPVPDAIAQQVLAGGGSR
ncbi:tRNA 2-selenouridine(34) synthase MnmH [Neolewinella agarilytica]|uniref:tRNA 2-selenouridine(34) synthase MnmH n=1 Tax=Neolewinella agarilytica TaxID=478744 RepID=UPI00235760DE|nr:tRNA 2-selenouridine(34) synthase MnmH [Neolewinella agarilytica]